MADVVEPPAGGGDLAAQQPLQRIGYRAAEGTQADDGHLLGGLQGLGDAVGVGAHQPAGAELDAAVVAHHGGEHTFEALVAQHVEHRAAGGAGGLAVVHRRRLPAGKQRPAHVGRARVPGAQPGDDGLGRHAAIHRLHAADETALLDEELAGDGGKNAVGHGGAKGKGWRPPLANPTAPRRPAGAAGRA